ncbi:MAG: hypothetical protein QOJ66_3328 [Ilumatobacteraceae bacterium]|jgi:hypothetical protein
MQDPDRDRGAMLPIVLVIIVVLALTVIGIATYVETDLQYGRITVDRANRLAAADAVMNYGIDQLKLRNAGCLLSSGSTSLPGLNSPVNGATTSVTCQRVGGGIGDIQAWAAVMTGIGVPTSGSNAWLLSTQSGNSADKILGGPVYMDRVTNQSFAFGPTVKIKDGPLYYHDATCASPVTPSSLPPELIFEPKLIYGPICDTHDWTAPTLGADPVVPDLSPFTLNPVVTTNGACQVFSPGTYTTALPSLDNSVYFKTGDYYFLNTPLTIDHSIVTAGFPDPAIVNATTPAELTNTDCNAAIAADGVGKVLPNFGATFYLGGSSYISVNTNGSLEIMPRAHGAFNENYVSIHALCSTTTMPTMAGCDQNGVVGVPSTLTATGAQPIVFTASGNQKQLITHGLLYAPTGRLEFGNATASAKQKILGGLVVARLVLQSSASAANFEIHVATSPVDYTVLLIATASKRGTTTVRAVVDYRPYEDVLDDRLAISSWWVG